MRMYGFFMRWCCLDVEFQTSVFDEVQFDFDLGLVGFEAPARIVFFERHGDVDRGVVHQLPQALGIEAGILGLLDLVDLLRGVHRDIEFQERGGRGFEFRFEIQRYGQSADDLPGEVERGRASFWNCRTLRDRGCRRSCRSRRR